MNTNEITRQLIKARAAERATYEALEAVEGIAGMDITGLLTTRRELGERIAELEVQQAEAKEADETKRLASTKKATVRRNNWDANSKVTVELTPARIMSDSWEVRFKGELLGTVDKSGNEWNSRAAVDDRAGGSSRFGHTSRADAIRRLLRRAGH